MCLSFLESFLRKHSYEHHPVMSNKGAEISMDLGSFIWIQAPLHSHIGDLGMLTNLFSSDHRFSTGFKSTDIFFCLNTVCLENQPKTNKQTKIKAHTQLVQC